MKIIVFLFWLSLLCAIGIAQTGDPPATINPARYLKLDRSLGTVALGKLADLVLLDANPLENIANTRRVDSVNNFKRSPSQLSAIIATRVKPGFFASIRTP